MVLPRFPLTQFHQEGAFAIVEFSDLRFPQIRKDRPASFTIASAFHQREVSISKGWVKR